MALDAFGILITTYVRQARISFLPSANTVGFRFAQPKRKKESHRGIIDLNMLKAVSDSGQGRCQAKSEKSYKSGVFLFTFDFILLYLVLDNLRFSAGPSTLLRGQLAGVWQMEYQEYNMNDCVNSANTIKINRLVILKDLFFCLFFMALLILALLNFILAEFNNTIFCAILNGNCVYSFKFYIRS